MEAVLKNNMGDSRLIRKEHSSYLSQFKEDCSASEIDLKLGVWVYETFLAGKEKRVSGASNSRTDGKCVKRQDGISECMTVCEMSYP